MVRSRFKPNVLMITSPSMHRQRLHLHLAVAAAAEAVVPAAPEAEPEVLVAVPRGEDLVAAAALEEASPEPVEESALAAEPVEVPAE